MMFKRLSPTALMIIGAVFNCLYCTASYADDADRDSEGLYAYYNGYDSSPDHQRHCQRLYIGSLLNTRAKIDFHDAAQDGDLIDMVCKRHPLHAEQTIVALFYVGVTPNAKYLNKGCDNCGDFGLMMAVIDLKQRKVISVFHGALTQDATTIIEGSKLQIDTARYNLASDIRAIGLRMRIGASTGPCSTEYSDDYLSLFIEDGSELKPVLTYLPMVRDFAFGEGKECPDATAIVDSIKVTISVAPSFSEGWHDLELVANHEYVPGKIEQQPLGLIRAQNHFYAIDAANIGAKIWEYADSRLGKHQDN